MSKFRVGQKVLWHIGEGDGVRARVMTIAPTNYHQGYDYEVLADDRDEPDGGMNGLGHGLDSLAEFVGVPDYHGYEAANENELELIEE
jgi:hypothetical protein